jgi:hypothetical protein
VFHNTKNVALTNLKFENCFVSVNFTKEDRSPSFSDQPGLLLPENTVLIDNVHVSKCSTGLSFEGDVQPSIFAYLLPPYHLNLILLIRLQRIDHHINPRSQGRGERRRRKRRKWRGRGEYSRKIEGRRREVPPEYILFL